jgi:outer membrane lipoprotein carrier protein
MKKLLLGAILFLPLSFSAAQNFAADALAKHLDFTSYTADFKQSLVEKNKQPQLQSVGKMALLRPAYFRWESMRPTHQILVADKKMLQIYDVDLMQVTKESVDQNQAFNPAHLLSIDPANLQRDFAIAQVNLSGCKEGFSMRDLQSVNSPLVYLCFNNNGLAQMQMVNNLGESTIFSFSNIHIDPQLNANYFTLKLPAGVDVVQR